MMENIKKPEANNNGRSDTNTNKDSIKSVSNQYYTVKKAFAKSPATMLMIAHQTGIERANICRYIATMKRRNEINLIGFGLCHISGFKAGFYSTSKRG
jgi:hypothetical protein